MEPRDVQDHYAVRFADSGDSDPSFSGSARLLCGCRTSILTATQGTPRPRQRTHEGCLGTYKCTNVRYDGRGRKAGRIRGLDTVRVPVEVWRPQRATHYRTVADGWQLRNAHQRYALGLLTKFLGRFLLRNTTCIHPRICFIECVSMGHAKQINMAHIIRN